VLPLVVLGYATLLLLVFHANDRARECKGEFLMRCKCLCISSAPPLPVLSPSCSLEPRINSELKGLARMERMVMGIKKAP
jgi:hypothetical protein